MIPMFDQCWGDIEEGKQIVLQRKWLTPGPVGRHEAAGDRSKGAPCTVSLLYREINLFLP